MTGANGLALGKVVRIAEPIWREAASRHAKEIKSLLGPGLTDPDHFLNSGRHRNQQQQQQQNCPFQMTSLDPRHPVYNFMIEYYGLKGAKGPKRLARWSPDPALIVSSEETTTTSLEQLSLKPKNASEESVVQKINEPGGVLLEGATEDDLGGTLHLRGAMPCEDGVLYSPASFYGRHDPDRRSDQVRMAAPFLWFRSIMANTLVAEPILHCHGLHEWAMQYHPPGAPPPPSAKYQSHLSLRVSQDVINKAVERRGVSCTHVDALRYFAPAAGPLNRHGAVLERTDQLRLEQPACVHAHMDLLKIALRLQPFLNPALLVRALDTALQARKLDVAASPYDATAYGVPVVPIETRQGRQEYRRQQMELMERAEPVRRDLLEAYSVFLGLAFDESIVESANRNPSPVRFAKAEPGGLPWRKNLIETQ